MARNSILIEQWGIIQYLFILKKLQPNKPKWFKFCLMVTYFYFYLWTINWQNLISDPTLYPKSCPSNACITSRVIDSKCLLTGAYLIRLILYIKINSTAQVLIQVQAFRCKSKPINGPSQYCRLHSFFFKFRVIRSNSVDPKTEPKPTRTIRFRFFISV